MFVPVHHHWQTKAGATQKRTTPEAITESVRMGTSRKPLFAGRFPLMKVMRAQLQAVAREFYQTFCLDMNHAVLILEWPFYQKKPATEIAK